MLPKEKRLNLKKDFKWVASGQKLGNNFFQIFIRFGDNPLPKVGIATSKANFKKAVERNRARRLTSKCFESLYELLPEGVNIIAMPRADVLQCKATELIITLEELLKKGKVLKDENNNH